MYFWRGNWVHSRFFQKLTIFLHGAVERARQGREGGAFSLPPSVALPLLQSLRAIAGLGLRLPATAESTAPAAFAPSVSMCSTCKADQFIGPSVRLLGSHPAPPPPHHTPSGAGLPKKKPPSIPKDPRTARDLEKPGRPEVHIRGRSEPFPQEASRAPGPLPPREPFSPRSATSMGLRGAQPLSPLFYTQGS